MYTYILLRALRDVGLYPRPHPSLFPDSKAGHLCQGPQEDRALEGWPCSKCQVLASWSTQIKTAVTQGAFWAQGGHLLQAENLHLLKNIYYFISWFYREQITILETFVLFQWA